MTACWKRSTREGTALIGSVIIHVDDAAPVARIRAKANEIVQQSKLWDRKVVNVQVTGTPRRAGAPRWACTSARHGDGFVRDAAAIFN